MAYTTIGFICVVIGFKVGVNILMCRCIGNWGYEDLDLVGFRWYFVDVGGMIRIVLEWYNLCVWVILLLIPFEYGNMMIAWCLFVLVIVYYV